jgi:hypothetical protein
VLQKRCFILFTDCLLYCKTSASLAGPVECQFPLAVSEVDTATRPQDYAVGYVLFFRLWLPLCLRLLPVLVVVVIVAIVVVVAIVAVMAVGVVVFFIVFVVACAALRGVLRWLGFPPRLLACTRA